MSATETVCLWRYQGAVGGKVVGGLAVVTLDSRTWPEPRGTRPTGSCSTAPTLTGARSRRCFGRTSTPTGRSNSTWIAGWTSAGLLQPILRDPQASTPRPDRDWPGPRGCDASPTQAPAPELVLRSGLWWEGLLGGVGR